MRLLVKLACSATPDDEIAILEEFGVTPTELVKEDAGKFTGETRPLTSEDRISIDPNIGPKELRTSDVMESDNRTRSESTTENTIIDHPETTTAGQEQAGSSRGGALSFSMLPSSKILEWEQPSQDVISFQCRHCGEQISIQEVKDQGGMCPICHSRYRIKNQSKILVEPASKPYESHSLAVGSILDIELSPSVGAIKCGTEDEAEVLRDLATENWPFLKKMLQWAYRLHMQGKCPKDKIVMRAISAFENNVDDQEETEINEPRPEQNTSREDLDQEILEQMRRLEEASRRAAAGA
jgi:hypothetical protein